MYVGQSAGGRDRARRPLSAAPHDTLSDREYQVLRMIGSGLTVSEIAAACGLSVKTVSTYRSRLLEKLEMHSNAEADALRDRKRPDGFVRADRRAD